VPLKCNCDFFLPLSDSVTYQSSLLWLTECTVRWNWCEKQIKKIVWFIIWKCFILVVNITQSKIWRKLFRWRLDFSQWKYKIYKTMQNSPPVLYKKNKNNICIQGETVRQHNICIAFKHQSRRGNNKIQHFYKHDGGGNADSLSMVVSYNWTTVLTWQPLCSNLFLYTIHVCLTEWIESVLVWDKNGVLLCINSETLDDPNQPAPQTSDQ